MTTNYWFRAPRVITTSDLYKATAVILCKERSSNGSVPTEWKRRRLLCRPIVLDPYLMSRSTIYSTLILRSLVLLIPSATFYSSGKQLIISPQWRARRILKMTWMMIWAIPMSLTSKVKLFRQNRILPEVLLRSWCSCLLRHRCK